MTTTAVFDPYEAWLGIAPQEQPADHYRLLGLARLENDAGRIARAADERMALVRSYQVGPRGAYTQKLLNELSAARVCLLTPASKLLYDAALGQRMRMEPGPFYAPQAAAPPRLPPTPPAAAEPSAPPIAEPDEEAAIAASAPRAWWRPMAAMLAAALLLLCAVGGYGWIRSLWPVTGAVESPPQPMETEPQRPAPRKIVVLQEGSGEVIFSPATATLAGEVELQVVGTEEVLAHWTTPDDRATWQFRLVKPGFFQAELTYATSAESEAPELELAIDEQAKACPLRTSGGLDQFHTDKFTLLIASGGQHTFVVRPLKQPAGDWLVLKTVRLVPVGANATPDPAAGEPTTPPPSPGSAAP